MRSPYSPTYITRRLFLNAFKNYDNQQCCLALTGRIGTSSLDKPVGNSVKAADMLLGPAAAYHLPCAVNQDLTFTTLGMVATKLCFLETPSKHEHN